MFLPSVNRRHQTHTAAALTLLRRVVSQESRPCRCGANRPVTNTQIWSALPPLRVHRPSRAAQWGLPSSQPRCRFTTAKHRWRLQRSAGPTRQIRAGPSFHVGREWSWRSAPAGLLVTCPPQVGRLVSCNRASLLERGTMAVKLPTK